MNIRYLKHDEISKLKWDKCVSQSFNGIAYAFSWYLDIVSYQWDALVMDDYKAIMPLTAKSGYGFSKIIQPNFAPQLGVFTSERLNVDLVNSFLNAIPDKFKSVNLNLNAFNKVSHKKFHIKQEISYELDLILPYKTLFSKFSKEVKQHVKKSKDENVSVSKHLNLKDFLLLKKNNSDDPLTFEHMNILRRIIPFCTNHNIGETYGAYNDKNELVAGAFFMKSHQKAICLLAACSNEGKEISAGYAIFNNYINEYAEKSLTFDFGSYQNTDKEFSGKGFNAVPVTYPKLKRSRFRWFFSLKKHN